MEVSSACELARDGVNPESEASKRLGDVARDAWVFIEPARAVAVPIVAERYIAQRMFQPTEPNNVVRKPGNMPFALYAGARACPPSWGDEDPLLQRLPYDGEAFAWEIWLVVHADLRYSPLLRAVIEFIVEVIGETFKADAGLRWFFRHCMAASVTKINASALIPESQDEP